MTERRPPVAASFFVISQPIDAGDVVTGSGGTARVRARCGFGSGRRERAVRRSPGWRDPRRGGQHIGLALATLWRARRGGTADACRLGCGTRPAAARSIRRGRAASVSAPADWNSWSASCSQPVAWGPCVGDLEPGLLCSRIVAASTVSASSTAPPTGNHGGIIGHGPVDAPEQEDAVVGIDQQDLRADPSYSGHAIRIADGSAHGIP